MPLGAKLLEGMCDYLLWYVKDANLVKYRPLFQPSKPKASARWTNVELPNGTRRKLTREESENLDLLPTGAKVYRLVSQRAPSFSEASVYGFTFRGRVFNPPIGGCWVTTKEKMQRLADCNRLEAEGDNLSYVYFHNDFPYSKVNNYWDDTSPVQGKTYVVQTTERVIERCILMSTDPGDLVFDPTCGSGTTAYVAEEGGAGGSPATHRAWRSPRQTAADDRRLRLLRAGPPARGCRKRLYLHDRASRHAQVHRQQRAACD